MAVKFSNGQTLVDAKEPAKVQRVSNTKTTDLFRGYPANIFQRLLDYVAKGDTLAQACNRKGMPTEMNVRNRLNMNPDMMRRYQEANNVRIDSGMDEITTIADRALYGFKTISPADALRHAELKIRARVLVGEKTNPAKYGKAQAGEGGTVIVHNSLEVERTQTVNSDVGVTFKGGGNA
jgi:hypothetical protein